MISFPCEENIAIDEGERKYSVTSATAVPYFSLQESQKEIVRILQFTSGNLVHVKPLF